MNLCSIFLSIEPFPQVSEYAKRGRSDDTSKLKGAIVELIYEDPRAGSRFKDDYDIQCLLAGDDKDTRGFYHLDTADLLVPLSMREDFNDDPV